MNAAILFFFYYSSGGVAPPPPDPGPEPDLTFVSVDIQYLASSQSLLAEDGTELLAEDDDSILSEAPSDEWVSLINDVRTSEPIVLDYGIKGVTPADRIANAGSLSFALNNGEWNSAGTIGYYSPAHPDHRDGFDLNVPIRMVLTQNTQAPFYKFYGRLGNVSVEPGVHAGRVVHCTALDIMDDYARAKMPPIEMQFDSNGSELLERILEALPDELQPALTYLEPGLEDMPVAFDNIDAHDMTVREAMNDVCLSEFSQIYITGSGAEPGGQLHYANRHHTTSNAFVFCSFTADDIAVGGLEVPASRDDIVNKVQVTTYPLRIGSEPQVLYSLESASLAIQNGETFTGLYGAYRDPDNISTHVGGTDMLQPVAYRDYTMNTTADGSGIDITGSFDVTADFASGTGVRFTIVNRGGIVGYVTKLLVYGTGIYRTQSTYDTEVLSATYGQNVMQVDMPYQSSINIGRSIANYLSATYSQAQNRVSSVTFLANRTLEWLSYAIVGDVGYRVKLSEDVTGITDAEYTIRSVRMEIVPGAKCPQIWCTWYLEPALSLQMWALGTGALVSTTTLGF